MVNESKDDMKEFEEEFDFESEDTTNDALPIEDEDALSSPTGNSSRDNAQGIAIDRKPSKLPWLIGLAAASFIGWQGYKMIFSGPTDEVSTPVVKQESKPTQAVVAAKQTSMPQQQPATLPTQTTQNQQMPGAAATQGVTPVQGNMQIGGSGAKNPDLFSAPPAAPVQPQVAPPPKPAELEALEENVKKSQERMGKLESKFSELMDSMGSLNQGMSQVTRELSTISDSVQKLNKDVKTLKSQSQAPAQQAPAQQQQGLKQQPDEKYETKPVASGQMSVGSTPTMSVHAIIPGRAWLKSKDGSTITVTEGDSLDRYGKVLVIDASNGVVITSSGVTLR
jgi:uncharacterized coiled-coil protein SlyX